MRVNRQTNTRAERAGLPAALFGKIPAAEGFTGHGFNCRNGTGCNSGGRAVSEPQTVAGAKGMA